MMDASGKILATDSVEDLLDWDQSCYAAHLYLVTYKEEVLVKQPGFASADAEVLSYLKSGFDGLSSAAILIESMRVGISSEHIEDALKKQHAIVQYESALKSRQLATFAFEFRDPAHPAINSAPLLRHLLYHWNFGGGTRAAIGQSVVHFFKKRFWQKSVAFSGTVEVSGSGITANQLPFQVTVRRHEGQLQLPWVDTISFGISFGIALLVVYVAQRRRASVHHVQRLHHAAALGFRAGPDQGAGDETERGVTQWHDNVSRAYRRFALQTRPLTRSVLNASCSVLLVACLSGRHVEAGQLACRS
jgi:hypothetical protein